MEHNGPYLTIGIASYNYARYLPEAFDAICRQKFQDFEVLYCDDGSSDDSVAVIKGFIKNHPDMNIRLIEAENGGILANKNRILENARGQYLMICDADDYMSDDCLELLCGAAQREGADCVIGAFQEVDNDKKIVKDHPLPAKPSKWLFSQHHAQIYQTQLIREHGIGFTDIPDDVPYLQTMHVYCKKVAFVSEPVYFWRQHSSSASRDIAVHKEWSPVPIWSKLVRQMVKVRKLISNSDDLRATDYYMYKYYYINSFAVQDRNPAEARKQLKSIQNEMKQCMPRYRKASSFFASCKTGDTNFAKSVVVTCWLLEKVGLLHFALRLRIRLTTR